MAAVAAKQEANDELVPAYTFEVYFGNQVKVGFAKVSNIGMGEEMDWIPDGDEGKSAVKEGKRHKHHRWDHIVLERGMSTGTNDEVIRKLIAGVHLYNVMIMLLFNGKPVRMFSIEEGVITRCSFSDMDALRSEVIIRTMEIQHTGIEEVTV